MFNNPNPIPSTSQQASSNDPWSPQAATNSPGFVKQAYHLFLYIWHGHYFGLQDQRLFHFRGKSGEKEYHSCREKSGGNFDINVEAKWGLFPAMFICRRPIFRIAVKFKCRGGTTLWHLLHVLPPKWGNEQ